jgi:hypothetical protein
MTAAYQASPIKPSRVRSITRIRRSDKPGGRAMIDIGMLWRDERDDTEFTRLMQSALEGDPPVFSSIAERDEFERRYAEANPRWNRIPEARRQYLEKLIEQHRDIAMYQAILDAQEQYLASRHAAEGQSIEVHIDEMLAAISEIIGRTVTAAELEAADWWANAPSRKAFMERWASPNAEVTQINQWPHHVKRRIEVLGDLEAMLMPIANATRGLDPDAIKKLIEQHELAVAVYPGGFAPLKGAEHLWPPPPVIDTTVVAFWCATGEQAAEMQRVYIGAPGHGRN